MNTAQKQLFLNRVASKKQIPVSLSLFALACLGLLSGCESKPVAPTRAPARTPTTYVSAVLDPNYTLPPQSQVAVSIATNAPIETRRIAHMVTAQLQTNGFNVVESASARFLLWCITEEKLLGRESGYQFPYTYVFLHAYVTAELKAGKEKTIWEGRVVEASGPFNKAPESFVKTLVQFVGKDFKGDTPVLP